MVYNLALKPQRSEIISGVVAVSGSIGARIFKCSQTFAGVTYFKYFQFNITIWLFYSVTYFGLRTEMCTVS